MFTQQRRMDVVTNNIVNAETLGYKKDTMVTRSFKDLLIDRIRDPNSGNTRVGPLNTGIYSDEIFTSFVSGPLEQTNRTTDMAIEGDAFFVVETPDGERFTRSGDFYVNAEGYLVTPEGHYVLGDGGRMQVGNDFSLSPDGTVTNAQGGNAGKLRLETFEDKDVLRKQGHNLFYPYGDTAPAASQNAKVLQGYIENSNVDIGRELVDMIEVTRSYEANQRMARMIDETLAKTVNDVGRL